MIAVEWFPLSVAIVCLMVLLSVVFVVGTMEGEMTDRKEVRYMSWNFSVTNCPKDELRARLEAARNGMTLATDAPITEMNQQMDAAIDAAVALAETVHSSDMEKCCCPFNIVLSGHANPDHMPTEGYSNDTVSITVSNAGSNESGG